MTATIFRSFHAAFPPSGPRVPYDAERHSAFAERVPPKLVDEWKSCGFGPYGGGLLWTPPPDEPFLDAAEWRALDGTGIEVLRSAFANVCLWQGGAFRWVNVHTGSFADYGSNVEVVLDATTEKSYRKLAFLEPMFRKARKRLGDLAADECFGFAPLPSLGGAMEDEYVVKVKMREYLALLAQTLS